MVSLFDGTGSYSKDLCAIDKLNQVLNEDNDTKRCEEKNQVRSFLLSKGIIDKSINSNAKNGGQSYGQKKRKGE